MKWEGRHWNGSLWFIKKLGHNRDRPYWARSKRVNGKTKTILQHVEKKEMEMGRKTKKGYVIDHKDGDSLNNNDCNLREIEKIHNFQSQKPRGEIKSRGVIFCKTHKKYVARITKDKKRYHLGYFATLKEAEQAYRKRADEIYHESINRDLFIIQPESNAT